MSIQPDVDNLNSLESISEVLQTLGYETARQEDGIAALVTIDEKQFPVALAIDPEDNGLRISASLGEVNQMVEDVDDCEEFCHFLANLALLNPLITPFACGILENDTDEVDDDPVVLVNKVPLGDFCIDELQSAMDGLRGALLLACPRLGIQTEG